LAAHVRGKPTLVAGVRPKVIGNAGTTASTTWPLTAVDILVNHEDTYAHFITWSPPAWVSHPTISASRFAHLVHASPNDAATKAACAASERKKAGYIYVTPDVVNLWHSQPTVAMLGCSTLFREWVLAPPLLARPVRDRAESLLRSGFGPAVGLRAGGPQRVAARRTRGSFGQTGRAARVRAA
jgi:hypothetical protein